MIPTLRVAFYGDDFTGSSDAMEALALSGLRTVLFLRAPSAGEIAARFADVRCVGVAGTSRAMSPAEMDAELVPVLEAYGRCARRYYTTKFVPLSILRGRSDIGHVVDRAGQRLNNGHTVPMLPVHHPLRRYTVFGNHLAAAGDAICRLDRHPTMSRHPVTPMLEADLRRHIADQTRARESDERPGSRRFVGTQSTRVSHGAWPSLPDLLLDVLDDIRLRETGRLMWEQAAEAPHFIVGSSGVGYALAAHWRTAGIIPNTRAQFPAVKPIPQLLVLSGSASPITAQQIAWARDHSFEVLRVPAATLMQSDGAAQVRQALYEQALAAWSRGLSIVLYTAAGPDDPAISAARAAMTEGTHSARVLGGALGRLARELIASTGLRRILIAGGDTSSYATQELGVHALEMAAELTPGAPLCRAHSNDLLVDGLEIALKGGQMGGPDYFGRVRGE